MSLLGCSGLVWVALCPYINLPFLFSMAAASSSPRAASGSSGTFHLTQQLLSRNPIPANLLAVMRGKSNMGEALFRRILGGGGGCLGGMHPPEDDPAVGNNTSLHLLHFCSRPSPRCLLFRRTTSQQQTRPCHQLFTTHHPNIDIHSSVSLCQHFLINITTFVQLSTNSTNHHNGWWKGKVWWWKELGRQDFSC